MNEEKGKGGEESAVKTTKNGFAVKRKNARIKTKGASEARQKRAVDSSRGMNATVERVRKEEKSVALKRKKENRETA